MNYEAITKAKGRYETVPQTGAYVIATEQKERTAARSTGTN
ncbi:MAG: hypothetical protein ACKVP3_24160 [Hyphomicrobiaceae bacterium]